MAQKIEHASFLYAKQLVGKTFMYVFDKRFIEVIYKKDNFLHFTGVDSKLSAGQFFKLAKQGKLGASQFYFSPRHYFENAKKKVNNLSTLPALATGESLMVEDVTTQTSKYKFGNTDLKLSVLFEKSQLGNNSNRDIYFGKSFRVDDCFNKSQNQYVITYIFSKPNDKKQYDTLLYKDKSAILDDLPNQAIALLSDEIKVLLSVENLNSEKDVSTSIKKTITSRDSQVGQQSPTLKKNRASLDDRLKQARETRDSQAPQEQLRFKSNNRDDR